MSKCLPRESGNKIFQGQEARRNQKESQTSPRTLQQEVGGMFITLKAI